MKKQSIFLCAIVLVFGVVHQVLAKPLFKGLGSLGSSGSYLSEPIGGISSDGKVVVGQSRDAFGLNHAFRWSESTGMVSIAGPDSGAKGVSSDGSVIIVYSEGQAFRWTEETGMEGLGTPPGGTPPTSAQDVSGDGSVVVGYSNPITEGWVWEDGQGFTNLGRGSARGVSDDGTYVTGVTVDAAFNGEAFIWSEDDGMTTLGFLPNSGYSSYGYDISADGSTVVGIGWISDGYEAFRWTEETGMEGLGDLPGGYYSSIPYAVSGDGSILVGEGNSGTPNGAFIWEPGTGMRSLYDVLQDDFGLDLNGWELWQARGISSDGKTIVGSGRNPSGQVEAWIAQLDTPDPDPNDDDGGGGGGGGGCFIATPLLGIFPISKHHED